MRRSGLHLIAIGVLAAVAFWVVEATVDALLFETGSIVEKMFDPRPHEAWMRALVVVVILIFAVYAYRINARLERSVEERTHQLQQLRREAERLAVEEERHRLAADLHDSVSQTLFSVSLIADALPRLWEQDPDQARVQMEELSQLTRAALGEMRALLLELRPDSLAGANPGDLLKHVIDSVGNQGRLQVDTRIDCAASPGPTINAVLYRIVQGALNNVARHSGASRATVFLTCRDDRIELEIGDEGCGFDPGAVPAEKLGLRLIRERAASSGARLEIDSGPDRGTRIAVTWDVLSSPR
jgi:signal transduction histidine kinase